MATSADVITLSRVNWSDPRQVRVSGVACDWSINAPGALHCALPVSAAQLTTFGDDLKGLWLVYDHATAGRWAGVVVDNQANGDGTMSLNATSMHWLLAKKRVSRRFKTGNAPPGALALRIVRDVANERVVWITDIQADEDGELVSYEFRGDDAGQAIATISYDSHQSYTVTVTDDGLLAFEWRVDLGSDKTGSVLLRENCELANVVVTESIDSVVNDIRAVSDERDWLTSVSSTQADPNSIDLYGRRQETRAYIGADSSSLAARARTDLLRDALPVRTVTADMAASHPMAAEVREGDYVLIWCEGANCVCKWRITNRALDNGWGTIHLAGDMTDLVP